MQTRAAACTLTAIIAVAWMNLFSSFGLAVALAVPCVLVAPFTIFIAALPRIVRQRD